MHACTYIIIIVLKIKKKKKGNSWKIVCTLSMLLVVFRLSKSHFVWLLFRNAIGADVLSMKAAGSWQK